MSKNETHETTDVLVKMVDLLKPLTSTDRHRVISAALMLIGDAPLEPVNVLQDTRHNSDEKSTLPPRASKWLRQNSLSIEEIDEVFHLSGNDAEIIAPDVPGKNFREKTINAYILTGISRLLFSDEPSFDDKSARIVCKNLGCLNEANHSVYISNRGNVFSGSKEKGWVLTAPGLKLGAALINEMAGKKS